MGLPPGATLVSGEVPMALPPGATLVSGGPPKEKIARKPGMDASQLRAGGWTTEDLQKAGFGAAALSDENEPISSGAEQPVEKMMSPQSQRQATKGGIAVASTIPLAFVPGTWPLIGKVAAATAAGAATGAAQTAVDEHPSGSDMLKNMGEQGALYGGSELGVGLLGRAFNFLRSLRGVKQAAGAAAAETAAVDAAAPKPAVATPQATGSLSEMASPAAAAAPAKPIAPLPPTEKPAGDIIGERLGILDKDPQSLMTSALKPGTNNARWATDAKTFLPDVKAAEAELGRPIKTFADGRAAAKIAKTNLWDQFTQKLQQVKLLGPNAPSLTNIDGNKIADAMMQSIDARTAAQNQPLVDRITKVANTYRRSIPADEAEEFLESANNELNSYYAKNKVGQEVAARDPEVGHVVKEANELRNQLYSKLDELTGPGARELKQRYGAVSNFQDVLSKRENVALRQQPQSMAEQISKARAYAKIAVGIARGDPWSVYEGVQQSTAATWLKERQTSEAMMERAFANYGRPAASAAPKIEAPKTPSVGTLRRAASQQQSSEDQ